MAQRIAELKAILDLLREYGVTHYKGVNLEIVLPEPEPSIITKPDQGEIINYTASTGYKNVYDNPDLYPDGQVPQFYKPDES